MGTVLRRLTVGVALIVALAACGSATTPTVAPAANPTTAPTTAPTAVPTAVPTATPNPSLITGSMPAFAILLPEGWQVASGGALLRATSKTGGVMVLANEAIPPEATFNDYALRVEKDTKMTSTNVDVKMTFRQAGTGLIGRIGIYPSGSTTSIASLFLYPACADGARTLSLTGPGATLLPTPPDRGLDTFDVIAANLDPCAETAAPALVLDPAVIALIDPYIAISNALSASQVSTEGFSTISDVHKQVKINLAAEETYIAATTALSWTPALQPLVDTLVSVHREIVVVYQKQMAAKTVKAFNDLIVQTERLAPSNLAAANALRLAMGRATIVQ
jgi:hypothetical protein